MSFNQIIKYGAIAFAVFLIVNIFIGISSLLFGFSTIFRNDKDIIKKMKVINEEEINNNLDIELSAGNIEISRGDKFSISTNNKTVKVNNKLNKTIITDKKININTKKNSTKIEIVVPDDFNFDKLDIELGFGKVIINDLNSNILEVEIGAGDISLNNILINNDSSIEMGAGDISIVKSNLNNLNLQMGAGSTYINSKILGKNKIELGTGSIDLDLIGEKELYKFMFNSGIGEVKIDGEKIKDKDSYGNGLNTIKLDGIVKDIDISFNN